MLRFWWPPIVALVIFFSALIALLNFQPYRNHALQEFLALSGDCAAPCWWGIRPSVTDLSQMMAILEGHEWVAEVDFAASNTPDSGFLTWDWRAPPPDVIDSARSGTAGIHRGIVTWLQIPTAFALGDVWLTVGQPNRSVTVAARAGRDQVRHHLSYTDEAVQ